MDNKKILSSHGSAFMNFKTLKMRINLMTTIYGIIIIVISSSIMFSILTGLINKRLQEDNLNHLTRTQASIESDILKLNSVSLLFTPYGNLGEAMLRFNQIDDIGEKGILMTKIKADMNVIDFSNPDINLCLFYVNDDYADFIATSSTVNDIDFDQLPTLFATETNTYYGPHITAKSLDKELVFSVKRNVNMGTNLPTFVYVECDFKNTLDTINNDQDSNEYINILTNNEDVIVYSTDESDFKLGQTFKQVYDESTYVKFELEKKQPWRVITLVKHSTLNNLKKELIFSYLAQYPIFLLVGIIFSFILVNIIARPLQRLQEGINQMEKGDFDTLIPKTNIYEFDSLIIQIHKAKLRISILLDEVKLKEKKRAFAEVSRLRAQINPHFVLNTLNTIHWMALEEKQNSIDNIVLSLTKILSYNLKNDNFVTTIGEELEATKEYLKLQQLKYDLTYTITNHVGVEVLQYEMPRFVLQPLVENSIIHGKSDQIAIDLLIESTELGIRLVIRDQGGKIEDQSLAFINNHKEKPEQLGIGLSYVFSALNSHYKKEDLICFKDIQTGLEISILLPFERGDEDA